MASTAYVQAHSKNIMKEIVTNALIGLLIRNHKFRTGSETVMVFDVFLQVKINTFLPIHEKITSSFTSSCTILNFLMFSLSLSLSIFGHRVFYPIKVNKL